MGFKSLTTEAQRHRENTGRERIKRLVPELCLGTPVSNLCVASPSELEAELLDVRSLAELGNERFDSSAFSLCLCASVVRLI
jgi:hypothetical protein